MNHKFSTFALIGIFFILGLTSITVKGGIITSCS